MFGNQNQAGRVNFHDARVRNGDRVVTLSRTHVAITRDTRTAAGGALLTMETVPSETKFTGTIVLTNPSNWMVGAVLATLDLLPKIGLGAKKTSGYGKVNVQVTCLEHDYPAGNRPDPEPTQEEYQKIYREAWENLLKKIREKKSG
jgi:CRISPR/Cas system CSM-associated protein Csm3 (group 7 of RAMP superfamily)